MWVSSELGISASLCRMLFSLFQPFAKFVSILEQPPPEASFVGGNITIKTAMFLQELYMFLLTTLLLLVLGQHSFSPNYSTGLG